MQKYFFYLKSKRSEAFYANIETYLLKKKEKSSKSIPQNVLVEYHTYIHRLTKSVNKKNLISKDVGTTANDCINILVSEQICATN